MRRKAIGSAIGAALVTSAFVSGAVLAQDKPQVLVWTDPTRAPGFETYRDLVADTVDVQVEIYDTTALIGKIQQANVAGSGWPDAVFAQPGALSLLQSQQIAFTQEFTPELVGDGFLDGFGAANDWCVIDGKTWCLKNDLAQSVLWYDTVLFEELGLNVPTTMEEWAAEAMKLEGTGYTAGAIGDQNFYASYLWPSGCPMAEPVSSTEVRVNSQDPKCTRVADLVQPLVDAGVLDIRSNFDAGFMADLPHQGKVAMTFGPSWFGDHVIKPEASWAVPAGRISAAAMPVWEGDDVGHSGEWGGGIFVVSSHSEATQAAVDAVKWMVSDPEHVTNGDTFPAYGPANELWTARIATDEYYASDPGAAMTVQSQLINPSVGPVRMDVDAQIGSTLVLPIAEGAPIQEAIDTFAEQLRNLAPTAGYSVTE